MAVVGICSRDLAIAPLREQVTSDALTTQLNIQLLSNSELQQVVAMATQSMSRQALRSAFRRCPNQVQSRAYSRIRPSVARNHLQTPSLYFALPAPRLFSSSVWRANIKLPDGGEAPQPEAHEETPTQKTEISTEEYHQRADEFLDALQAKLEARQETKGDLDVEYSVRSNLMCCFRPLVLTSEIGRCHEH